MLSRSSRFTGRKFVVLAVVLAGLLLRPGTGAAIDLGLTPSQVFSLWTNIDDSLLAVARVVSDDADWYGGLAAMAPEEFTDKTPGDVLGQVEVFRAKLDRLRQSGNLKLTERFEEVTGEVTPSVVYLNSGHVLNAQIDWLIRNTGPSQLVSQFYVRHGFTGKRPSDVFGLVDLANRRIDLILAKRGV